MKLSYIWLEKHLPKIDCLNCGTCCGIILCTVKENEAIKEYCEENGIVPISQGVLCPYFQVIGEPKNPRKGCAIYEVRPFACRLLGHTEKLRCFKGRGTNQKKRTVQRLFDRYKEKFGDLYELIWGSNYNEPGKDDGNNTG